ncbi:MAG: hypothetical protein RMI43_00240 [Candidatus Caldarchaeum sp.]|nr:hypothetical protein [Candidatus Caldarchaeum sp.]
MGLDRVYWTKFALGIFYGFAAAWIVASFKQPLFTYLLIFSAAFIYIGIAEFLWRVIERDKRRRSSYLNGLGGFIGIFLLTWILFFNLLTAQ